MRITKIEVQKNNPRRKSIFLDGEFAFGLSDEVLIRHSLRAGTEISKAELSALVRSDDMETAKGRALRFIAIRPRTRKEIVYYLQKKAYSGEIADAVASHLEEIRMVDDVEFSRMYCRDTVKFRPVGKERLRQKLASKGVARAIIDAVLPEFFPPDKEEDLAMAAARRHYQKLLGSSRKIDPPAMKKKLSDYLLRRGFSYNTVQSVTTSLMRDNK